MAIAAQTKNIVMEFANGSDKNRVLHGVDLQIPFGQLSFLIGPSGCGKTTMLCVMSGTLTPTSGQVEVLGTSLNQLKAAERVRFRRRNIGFVFQQYNLMAYLSAAENAAIPLIADGVKTSHALAKARAVLAQLGMSEHEQKLPRQLSGGQQQRVAIARALVHDPALVVCDEPTAALDAKAGQAVMTLLDQASADARRAVLVVTHDDRIYAFADQIFEMEDGRLMSAKLNPQPHLEHT